jgi:hypothetical protein
MRRYYMCVVLCNEHIVNGVLYMYKYSYMHTYERTQANTGTHIHTHTHTHSLTRAYAHTQAHTYTHYTLSYTHSYTYTQARAHTREARACTYTARKLAKLLCTYMLFNCRSGVEAIPQLCQRNRRRVYLGVSLFVFTPVMRQEGVELEGWASRYRAGACGRSFKSCGQ